MCRVTTSEFEATTAAVPAARRWTRRWLEAWGLQGLIDVAGLLVSELVTNAVVHAGCGPVVTLAATGGSAYIGVVDDEPRLPGRPPVSTEQAERAFLAEGGRGLILVDALADEWGTTSLATGKELWLRLGIPDGWPGAAGCRCDDEQAQRTAVHPGYWAWHDPGSPVPVDEP